MNELFIMVAAYFSFCFTEWIGNIQTRYQIGNFFVDMILIVIILNQIAIIYEVGNDINREHMKNHQKAEWKRFYELKFDRVMELRTYMLAHGEKGNIKDLMNKTQSQLSSEINWYQRNPHQVIVETKKIKYILGKQIVKLMKENHPKRKQKVTYALFLGQKSDQKIDKKRKTTKSIISAIDLEEIKEESEDQISPKAKEPKAKMTFAAFMDKQAPEAYDDYHIPPTKHESETLKNEALLDAEVSDEDIRELQ